MSVEAFRDADVVLYRGDALDVLQDLEDGSVDACVTSPPYLDARPEYPSPTIDEFAAILRELRRIVTGALLLNVGRLFRDGVESLWWLELLEVAGLAGWDHRDTLVWAKPNANPIIGTVLTNAHEYVLMFGDGFDEDAVRTAYMPDSLARMQRAYVSSVSVKGDTNVRNGPRRDAKRGEARVSREVGVASAVEERGARAMSVFVTPVGAEKGNPHPAPMPLELAEHLVMLSGGRVIVDPFAGSGTTLLAARNLGRRAIGVELEASYCELIARRLAQQSLFVTAPPSCDPGPRDHTGSHGQLTLDPE